MSQVDDGFDDGFGPEPSARRESPGVVVTGELLPEKHAGLSGGAFEGADRIGREMGTWRPQINSPDQLIGKDKMLLDGRAADMLRNNGPTIGASNTQKDSIVGAQYRLNANPAFGYLGLTEEWADEFQQEVEETFTLFAESGSKWCDVERTKTLTDMVRLAIGCYFAGGEVVATMNWMGGRQRPFRTAMQIVDAKRVSNPRDSEDSKTLRRGVQLDSNGAALGLHIRRALQNDASRMGDNYVWDYWPMRYPWGRARTLHLMEPAFAEQNRGIADLVAALKETRMGKKFHEVSLANAIVQASFAASIESELPPEMAYEMIGAGTGGSSADASLTYLQAINEYSRAGRNIEIDGTKIPYLFPGTKLKLTPAGTASAGMGDKLEESLNRYISTTLGISYEEYTHDYSQTNYSSLRAATNKTLRAVVAKKRVIADGIANAFYQCWLEEAITEGHLRSTRALTAANRNWFYERMNKDAVCRATWIGATRGQVDEGKETQAAIARIAAGLSTHEAETARLGFDFRDVFAQQAREKRLREKLGLEFDYSTARSAGVTPEPAATTGKTDDGFDE